MRRPARATPATVVLAAFPGLTGHAAGTEELAWLTLGADLAHVLAAGAWVGGLAAVLLLERAWRRREGGAASLLPALVPAFSPVALSCAGALALTGTLAEWVQLPDLASLAGTGYGRTLLVKLALVGGVAALGAVNWRRLTPRLPAPDGPRAIRRAAAVELAVANLVLLATAVLVRTSPSGH